MAKKVSAAIIVKNNKIFIAQRGPLYTLPYKWEFPGGKIDPGETPEQCLVREIKEELNITIKIDHFFCESYYEYPHGPILLLAYLASIESGDIELFEHVDSKWISIDELPNFDFSPADIPIINKLRVCNNDI